MKNLFSLFVFFASFLWAAPPQNTYPVVVLGGGVGGLTSALYLSRAGVKTVVVEGPQLGGAITQSLMVENWPGEQRITGRDLAEKMKAQVVANGAQILDSEIIAIDLQNRPFKLQLRSNGDQSLTTMFADRLIVAMGALPNRLNIPGENTYWAKGVSNCAICDGSFYKGEAVGVVGGGDSAVLEAEYLSNLASTVHIFVRKDAFRAQEHVRLDALLKKPNVKVHFGTTVEEILGDREQVTGVALNVKGKKETVALSGLFLGIGSTPNSQLFKGMVEMDAQGYIIPKKGQETSLPGVYVAGDIADPTFKQAVSAAADGAKAAMQASASITTDQATVQAVTEKMKQAASGVIEIQSLGQLEKELKDSDVPIFIDFYATWCGPCKKISPLIETSAEHLSGKVKFLKVNVDQVGELTKKYQIRSMPTVIMVDVDGNIVDRKVGSDEITTLLKSLDSSN